MDIAPERHHSRSEWWLYLGNGTCPLGGIDVQKEALERVTALWEKGR
jgi:hypothetical protein